MEDLRRPGAGAHRVADEEVAASPQRNGYEDQASILRIPRRRKAADIIEEMAPDEAADALAEMEERPAADSDEMEQTPAAEIGELLETGRKRRRHDEHPVCRAARIRHGARCDQTLRGTRSCSKA